MTAAVVLDIPDPDATRAFGQRLAGLLFPGAVVEALGADGRAVSSPTFVLIQEYEARLPVYHFDAYRLRGAAEFFDLGAHEYFEGKGVCLVEWADRALACLPAEHLRVTLTSTGETSRRCTIEGYGERYTALVARLAGGA